MDDSGKKMVTAYLIALAGFENANKTVEQARAEEEACRKKLFDAKESLASAVGYNKGDPPLSVPIPGEKRIIRFYTIDRDRCGGPGGSSRDYREIGAVIERLA